jgi:tetratricopeptide (TPR) repeat protein
MEILMNTIFFSLSDESQDRILFEELLSQLSVQRRHGLIKVLYDSLINPGDNRNALIQSFIRQANIIVLLISPDFFHSNQCFEVEMQYILEQQKERPLQVIPVLLRPTQYILRPTQWESFPFERSQFLPPNGRAISIWKNRDNALLEVVKGIHRVATNLIGNAADVLPPIKPLPFPLYTFPYRYNPSFTDRKDILAELHRSFTSGQNLQIRTQTLYGSEGVGKTIIATEYARHHHNEYQVILWLNARPPELLSANIVTLADQLGIPVQDGGDKQQRFAAVRHWLQHHEKWLVVLDNLEDFTLIKQLIPLQGSGHVLLITRTHPNEELSSSILVPQMSVEEAALLLLRRAQIISDQASSISASETDFLQASAIAQAVECYPLALDLAAAYIKETRCTLTTYIKSYRQLQRWAHLFGKRGWKAKDYRDPITITLLITFKKIARIDPNALKLLRFFAFLHPDALADEMIMQGASSLTGSLHTIIANHFTFHDAFALLQRFSLVHIGSDSTTVHIHSVVQAVIRQKLTKKQQDLLADQAVCLINATFPEVHFETWEECERYLPQALHCSTLLQDFHLTLEEGGLLLERLGFYYYQRGCYDEANMYLTQALRFQERYQSGNASDIAQTLNSLGLLSQRLAQYQDAKSLHQRALELRERVPDHPQIAESLHNLAVLYEHEGQYHQAEQLYLRALSLDEHAGRSDHPDTTKTLNNLALVYYLQGHYLQAKTTYQRVITIYEHSQFPHDPALAYALNGLGTLAEKHGDNQQAADLYQRALTIREQALGKEHSETAHSINKSARINELRGNYQQAQILYEQALTIGRKKLGPEHPDVALFLNNLALLAYKQGRYQQAEPLYQQALSIYEQTPTSERLDVAQVLNNLGQLYRKTQNEERAEALLQQALAIREQIPDILHHPDTAQILSNLGALLADQHQYEKAELLFQRALAILLPKFDFIHPDVTRVREMYASFLELMKRNEEAAQLSQPEAGQEEEQLSIDLSQDDHKT